jgi:putative transposase
LAKQPCPSLADSHFTEHKHTGISLLSPVDVHYGKADAIITSRQTVLNAAYTLHPELFVKKAPIHKQMPEAVWINPPKTPESQKELH